MWLVNSVKGCISYSFPGACSPDAFVQQILQLAWYRDQGYCTATYETASTRGMVDGRTDVIRTLSVESRDFVKAMLDENSDVSCAHFNHAA